MALVHVHQTALRNLRSTVGQYVETSWRALGRYDEADVAPFVARVVPVVTGAQRRASLLTAAYLSRRIGSPVPLDPAAFVGAAVRGGTSPADVYRRPFADVWAGLADGSTPWAELVDAAGARARLASATDIGLSMRATFAGAQQIEPRITGYRRVTSGGCDYCAEIDGIVVADGAEMQLHPGCNCDLEEILDEAVTPDALPDSLAVDDHGELGPVLVPAAA